MVKPIRFGIFPVPFPDETCYSLLCRYAVRRGRLTTSQICLELFGHTEPLSGYMFKPFRISDLQRWFEYQRGPLALEYGADHSCYQFYTAFLGQPDAEKVRNCRAGSALSSGQAKRINRKCGFPQGHKKNLWYCPECVREDIAKHGETCWRRLPQMPGAVYCPVHRERFRESGVGFHDISHQVMPATYALMHVPEPEQEEGTVFSGRYIDLSRDIAWLLDNGFTVQDREWLDINFWKRTDRSINSHLLYNVSQSALQKNRFKDYLTARITKDSGKASIDASVSRQIGRLLSIQELFGSVEKLFSV